MTGAQPSEYLCCTVCYPTMTLPTPTRLVIVAAKKLESKINDRSPIQKFNALTGVYCEAKVCREVFVDGKKLFWRQGLRPVQCLSRSRRSATKAHTIKY